MISEKIASVANALGTLAGAVPEDQWHKIRNARLELMDASDAVERMEKNLGLVEGEEEKEAS